MEKQESARIPNAALILFWLVFLALFAYSFQAIMDFEAFPHPRRVESFVRILKALSQPNFFEGENSREVASKMWETIQMGFLATTMGAMFATPLTFLSARASSFWSRGLNILLQPLLSAIRAIHPLLFTVPAIILVGIGATAGVLALTLFSTAILVGNFTEYAQQHPSLNWFTLFRIYFPGLALKHLPVNIMIATILGFMGGGGIGFLLQMQINLLMYRNVSVSILACIIVIGGLDLLARLIWQKIHNQKVALP